MCAFADQNEQNHIWYIDLANSASRMYKNEYVRPWDQRETLHLKYDSKNVMKNELECKNITLLFEASHRFFPKVANF